MALEMRLRRIWRTLTGSPTQTVSWAGSVGSTVTWSRWPMASTTRVASARRSTVSVEMSSCPASALPSTSMSSVMARASMPSWTAMVAYSVVSSGSSTSRLLATRSAIPTAPERAFFISWLKPPIRRLRSSSTCLSRLITQVTSTVSTIIGMST